MITASHVLTTEEILLVALAASVIPVLALILSMVYVTDRFRKIEDMLATAFTERKGDAPRGQPDNE